LKKMSNFAIETYQLTRRFGDKVAVDAVDLRAPSSGIYCFLGPNGAGKTTTIRMLLGLLRPDSGQVHILGQPISQRSIDQRRLLGSLVESPSYYAHLTGRENLEIIRQMRRGDRTFVEQALETVRLTGDAGRLVKTYSTGMKQRLGVAMALIGEPQLLILDEPTNGLDPAGILEMRSLLKRLAHEQGLTLFVSSHLLSEVEQIADTIGIISSGKLIFQGSKGDLQTGYSPIAVLRTDQPELAAMLLRQGGWSAELAQQEVRVSTNSEADVALIVQQLVSSGQHVFQAGLKQPSLEDVFLQKVGCEVQEKGM